MNEHKTMMETVYKQADNIVSRDVMGETLLVPIAGEMASMDNIYTLNETGNFIWNKIDANTSLATIRELLAQTYSEILSNELEADLLELVRDLEQNQLIEQLVEE